MGQRKGPNFLKDGFAGAVAGLCAKTVSAPLERLKIVLQTQAESKFVREGKTKSFSNMREVIFRITKDQGVLSWWRGNWSNIVRYVPQQAITFACKDNIRSVIVPDKSEGKLKVLGGNILSGALAGNIALTLIYPLDFARNRLAADLGKTSNREFDGMLSCWRQILEKDGIVGIYRGLPASWTCYAVYRGLLFGLYDTYRDKNAGFFKSWGIAYICTASAMCVAHPLETVRRRMMMTSGRGSSEHYRGGFHCFRTILMKEGLRKGLYAGLVANLLRSIPSQSLVLALFDAFKKHS